MSFKELPLDFHRVQMPRNQDCVIPACDVNLHVFKRTKGTINLPPVSLLKEELEEGLKRAHQVGEPGCLTIARWESQG